MTIHVRPATSFPDVQTMVGPKRPDANGCGCLSYRIPGARNRELTGIARGDEVRRLTARTIPSGVLAYRGDEVVGWAAVHRRSDTSFARNRRIPHVDNRGAKVDLTMAYVGTRSLFERAGFRHAAATDSTLAGFPRVLVRLEWDRPEHPTSDV